MYADDHDDYLTPRPTVGFEDTGWAWRYSGAPPREYVTLGWLLRGLRTEGRADYLGEAGMLLCPSASDPTREITKPNLLARFENKGTASPAILGYSANNHSFLWATTYQRLNRAAALDYIWAADRYFLTTKQLNHSSTGVYPDGHNYLFFDGSARWYRHLITMIDINGISRQKGNTYLDSEMFKFTRANLEKGRL
jgi:prepilin-type processing-associated H-X9-DG protein